MRSTALLLLLAACADSYEPADTVICAIANPVAIHDDAAVQETFVVGEVPSDLFGLAWVPVEGSVSAAVVEDGVTYTFVEDHDWVWVAERNAVWFVEYVPPSGTVVRVDYRSEDGSVAADIEAVGGSSSPCGG